VVLAKEGVVVFGDMPWDTLGIKKRLARCVWARVGGIVSGCRQAAEPFQLHVWHVYGPCMAGEGIFLEAVGFL